MSRKARSTQLGLNSAERAGELIPASPRRLRLRYGYSLVRVAGLVGLTPTVVRVYELDPRAVSPESRAKLDPFFCRPEAARSVDRPKSEGATVKPWEEAWTAAREEIDLEDDGEQPIEFWNVLNAEGELVCDLVGEPCAKLAAAAPDMARALLQLVETLGESNFSEYVELVSAARAALEKAGVRA